jgi:hypothetical protein
VRKFVTALLLFGSFSFVEKASAAVQIGNSFFTEMCVDNREFCSVLVINPVKGEVSVNVYPHLGYNVPTGVDFEGIRVGPASAASYNSLKALGLETLDTTIEELLSVYQARQAELDQIDGKIAAEEEKCLWSATSCGSGLVGAVASRRFWGLIPAAINCRRERMSCQDAQAIKSELRRQRQVLLEEIKKEEEEKAKAEKEAAKKDGGGGGEREGGRPSDTRAPGSREAVPTRGSEVTIRESRPTGGVPLGRRPVLF